MRTTQRTRLAALAATTVVSICSTEALADQACCVDTLYCIITQPEICDALGGTLRPDPNGTCEDWPASPCSNGAAGLHAPPHLQGGFGASMDLEFANGHVNHLVVGSPTTNETRGGATVMQWQIEEAFGGSWVEVSHFDLDTSSFAPGAYAGAAVAADGIWIAVGIPGRQEVRLFSNETGTWVERQTLTPIADGDDDGAFGLSLALDGSTLFIGAADSMPSGGRVSVFTTDGGTEQNPWVFEQHLTANVEGTQGFGYAIALDNQLGRAIIGAPFGGGGTAYSVQYADSEWEITRDLSLDLPAQYGELGAAVELVGDIAYIGNPGMNITGPTLGVVWAYQYSEDDTYPDSDFYMNTFIAAPEGSTGTQFGTSLNLQPGILLVGSPDEGGTGAVHIYTHPYNQPELIHFTWNAQINGSTVGEGFGASLVTGVLGADFDGATGGLALTGAPGAPSEPGGVSGAGRIDALNISDLNTGSSSFKPPIEFARTITYDEVTEPIQAIEHLGEWAIAGWPTLGPGGGIHLFKYESGTWNAVGDMIQGTSIGFGQSIAMRNGVAAIGSPQENGTGVVHLYNYSESGLVEISSLQPTAMNDAAAGSSLALAESPNGDMVLAIGAPGMDLSSPYSYPITPGAAYLYARPAGTANWSEVHQVNDNFGEMTAAGYDVDVTWHVDAFSMLIGLPYAYGNAGKVDHYKGTLDGAPFDFIDSFSPGQTGMLFGSSISAEQDLVVIGGPGSAPDFPYGAAFVIHGLLDGAQSTEAFQLTPDSSEGASNGARYGYAVDAHTIDGRLHVAVGMPLFTNGGGGGLDALRGGAVDLYTSSFSGDGEDSIQYVRQARILPRNAQARDLLGGSISFNNGRLLFSNGVQNSWMDGTPLPTFLTFETLAKSYWISPQGGDANENFRWSHPPHAGDTVKFSLLQSTVYYVGGMGDMDPLAIQIMFDSPILSTDGDNGAVNANMTSLFVASDAEIRTANVLIDGVFSFTDFVQLGGDFYSESGGMHVYGASQVNTNAFTQKANGQLMISVTDLAWDIGDPSFVLAENANIQGSLTMNMESSQIDQLNIGDRINLIQSQAVSEDNDHFDLIVFPSLPNDLAFTLVYEENERGPGQWSAYAEVVSLAGLLDFGDPNSVPVAGDPIAVETVDLTGDGADEICILFDGTPGSLAIFENDGGGGIAQQIIIPTSDAPTDITSGDFDADGSNDLAYACSGDPDAFINGSVTILHNEDLDISNGFESHYTHAIDGSPTCLTAINWDDIDPADLVVGIELTPDWTFEGAWQVLLATNGFRNRDVIDGPISFSSGIPIDVDPKPGEEEAPKDANIRFIGTTSLGQVAIGKRNQLRTGGSIDIETYSVGADLRGLTCSDIDGDGRFDIAAVSSTNNQLGVLLADTTTSDGFLNPVYVSPGNQPNGLISIDFDLDGNIDLATVVTDNAGTRGVRVLQNDGNLIFTVVETATGESPTLIDVGDVSGNGVAELVTITGGTALRGGGAGNQLSLRTVDDVVACIGDLDGNAVVDVIDLLALIAAWGECGGCPADLDGNGSVDVIDLLALIAAWGDCIS